LVPPGSKPPPLSNSELVESEILDYATARSVIHADGAQAYPSVIKAKYPKLRLFSVSHKNHEFTRKLRTCRALTGKHSKISGTQSIDSAWRWLDDYVPFAVKTKAGKGKGVNPLLWDYAWSWMWRFNSKGAFFETGQLFK